MMSAGAEHHRETRLMIHKRVDLYFYICAHVRESFAAGLCAGVGVCVSPWVCVGAVYLLRRLFTV